mmetsp:Transcript_11723/g.26158  ORF Transcript_11723/g.26158 Transcript_11723/m.26158 type:complete len:280 (-) Transcript_11723:86-925(-)
MPRKSRSREKSRAENGKAEKPNPPLKAEVQQSKVKQEVVDLEADDDCMPLQIQAPTASAVPAVPVVPVSSRRAKREAATKKEKVEKDEKKAKVKKEKAAKDEDRSRSRHRERKEKDRRRRSRSKSRKRKHSRSSSSSSSSSSASTSDSDVYRKLKPYTKVQLINLVRKAELNGMGGTVVHPSMAVSPCPPGCVLVRLDTGREIAVKTPNLHVLKSFHKGPHQSTLSQEQRLHQVLQQIKVNVDSVMDRTMTLRDVEGGSGMITIGDDPNVVQGGIGHML